MNFVRRFAAVAAFTGALASTMVASAATLSITQTGPATAVGDQTITFSATITNAGPDNLSNFVITGGVTGGGLSSVSGAGAACAKGRNSVYTCNVASFPAGSSTRLSISMRVDKAATSASSRVSAGSESVTTSVAVTPAAGGGGGGGGGTGGGGGGGGGTTTTAGVIKVGAAAAAACNNGTNMSVSIDKGSGGRTQEVITMSGNTAGFWMYRTVEPLSGRNVVSFGGNRNELGTVTSVQTVEVGSWLTPGTYALDFNATRTELLPGAPIDSTGTLLETCTATLVVTVA